MSDYGRALEFGFFPAPLANPPDQIERLVKAAEQAGLDLIGIKTTPTNVASTIPGP